MHELPQFAPDSANPTFDLIKTTDLVENLYPHTSGYESVSDFEPITEIGIQEEILGTFTYTPPDGSSAPVNFVGTRTGLYYYGLTNDGPRWVNISRKGGYHLGHGSSWSFAAFGGFIFAVAPEHEVQFMLAPREGDRVGLFSYLYDAPRAHRITVWGNYLALIDIIRDGSEDDKNNRTKVAWSGLNNPLDWKFGDASSDADVQVFNDGGRVVNATSGTNPYIFSRRKIHRGTFVPSSSIVFQFTTLNFDSGLKVPESLIEANGYIFFYSDSGFYKIDPAGVITNIGKDRVNNWVLGFIGGNDDRLMVGHYMHDTTRVYWGLRRDPMNTHYDLMLIYDYYLDRWSVVSRPFRAFLNYASTAYTLDRLDWVGNLDALPASLDSSVWYRESLRLAVIDMEGRISLSTGHAMASRISTGVISSGRNSYVQLREIGLATEVPDYTVKIHGSTGYGRPWVVGSPIKPGEYRDAVIGTERHRLAKIEYELTPPEDMPKYFITKYFATIEEAGVM